MGVQDLDWPISGHRNKDQFEILKEELHTALPHLQDDDFNPGPMLRAACGDPDCSAVQVQAMILEEIKRLEPPKDTPANAHSRRIYDVLYCRYVQKLTLEETSELLTLSVRHLTRLQRDAIHALARILWEQREKQGQAWTKLPEPSSEASSDSDTAHFPLPDWHAQMRQELASLERSMPGATADVTQVITEVADLENTLAPSSVTVEVVSAQPALMAAVHPSALRQMLISALGQIRPYVVGTPIRIFSRLENGNARITLAASVSSAIPAERDVIRYILAPTNASVEARIEHNRAYIWISLPSVGQVTVLVIDDNMGMAHFYRRATEGTRYRIVHVTQGREALEKLEAVVPNIIVLDVMLPDMDGWRLLMHLHQSPLTRSVPIIVCSVVPERELALSLGAAIYLPKPVRPRDFIQALDQALLLA